MQLANPAAELNELDRIAGTLGLDIRISFEGRAGEGSYDATGLPEDAALKARYMAIAREIVESEIGAGWAEQGGSSGTIRISGDGEPWLDADSEVEDWGYERVPELDEDDWVNAANRITPTDEGPSGP